MLNRVFLIGNLGRDPEFKVTQNGKEIGTFSLATKYAWKDEEEGDKSYTCVDWHRVIVVRDVTVAWMKEKLKKGDTVYVEGKLTHKTWIDKHNQPHVASRIVVFGREGNVSYLRSPLGISQETEEEQLEADNEPSKPSFPKFISLKKEEQ